jgi:hypothetical protein
MKQYSGSRIHQQANKLLHFEDGRLYFSKDTERRFFFALTLIMLVIGACFKLGVWQ